MPDWTFGAMMVLPMFSASFAYLAVNSSKEHSGMQESGMGQVWRILFIGMFFVTLITNLVLLIEVATDEGDTTTASIINSYFPLITWSFIVVMGLMVLFTFFKGFDIMHKLSDLSRKRFRR